MQTMQTMQEFNPLTTPDPSPILDGFLYNPTIRYTYQRYFALALGQMEVLRRAALLRPRWVVVPDSINQPIAAYDTLEYQAHVNEGSYLWGYQFQEYTGATGVTQAPTNTLVQVTDSCTGIPLFSDFAGSAVLSTYAGTPDLRGRPSPVLLSQPRLILAPGDLNVEIANKSGAVVYCQLVMYFAEPCAIVAEEG